MDYKKGTVLSYAGQGAEANRVVVRREGTTVVVTDEGAQLDAGVSCAAVTTRVVRCDGGAVPMVGYRLQGGDGNDVITLLGSMRLALSVGQPQLVLGGAGDDVLSGGDDPDRIAGGPGRDELRGGAGDDVLFNDARVYVPEISAGDVDGAEPDRADGGAGSDTVDYSRRTRALTLRLAGSDAGGGEHQERDRLENVENVLGGDGNDVISGNDRPNRLQGAGGADLLVGGDGDDELVGGAGADTLRGGSGDDRLGLGDFMFGRQPADSAFCGPGRDIVGESEVNAPGAPSWVAPDANDELRLDCEDVPFGDSGSEIPSNRGFGARPLRRGQRVWIFSNPCRRANLGRCSGRVELARPGAHSALASARFTHSGNVRIRLGPAAASRLARTSRVAIRVRAKQLGPIREQPLLAFVLAFRR